MSTIPICLKVPILSTTHSGFINLKAHTDTAFNIHNFTCHKLEHFIHILGIFVPHSTLIEINVFQSFYLLLLDKNTPQFLLPTKVATIVQDPAAEEFRKEAN